MAALRIAFACVAFVALPASLLGADLRAILDRRALCASDVAVEKLACRTHRESLYGVSNRLQGLAKDRGLPKAVTERAPLEALIQRSYLALGLKQDEAASIYLREAAVAALDLTPYFLSTPLYAFDIWGGGTAPSSLQDAVARGIGICGHQAELFGAILKALGLKTRPVQFWWRDDEGKAVNHIAVEVVLDGKWRLFDPTFGAYFLDERQELLGTEEIRRGKFIPMFNPISGPYRSYKYAGLDPFAHLSRDRVNVTFDHRGVVDLIMEPDREDLVTHFKNIPNYVGDNRLDGDPSGVSFRFLGLSGAFIATLDVSGHGECNKSTLQLDEHSVAIAVGAVSVSATAPSTLSVRGADDACYVVLKSLRLTRVP